MSKGKILIVDDELAISYALQISLELAGYQTTPVAASGHEAIAIASTERPDLILMDINLAGDMNGIETARVIYSNFNIRSIFVSGYPESEMGRDIHGDWSLGYICKPYSVELVEETIHSVTAV